MKKTILAIFIAAVMVLSACQGKSSASGGGSGKVTLELMHFQTIETIAESTEVKGYHAMKDKYIAEHPDIKVNESILQQIDYQTKIMALAAADEMPDIFFTKGSWVQNFYDNNLMADLTGKINPADYRDGVFLPVTRNGKIYGSPIQLVMTSLIFYNEKMFNDIGYDHFPTTWDELVDANTKFKAKGMTTIALGNKDRWPYESCILSALGDRFTGNDWTQSIILNDGKAKFTDPAFVTALRYSQQMASMFNVNFNEINNNQADALYCTGKAASTIEGMWAISYILQNADPDVLANTKIAILPSVPGQKGAVNATSGGAGWAQSINAKLTGAKLDAAIEYMKQTTGTEYSQFIMDDSGLLGPIDVPVKGKSSLPALSQFYLDFTGTLSYVPVYDILMDGAVIDVMNSKLQELLAGTATPEAVAAAIQAEQDKIQ
ncbi:extracellular solute-binding protein [Treponema primitia]|uniref:extracellular solute-binding protein n=1 Tax=Treponema primitia TaxID=88058 RepID=UPI00025550CC|nr:extracellular solute-binding protein [Treponema primitia]